MRGKVRMLAVAATLSVAPPAGADLAAQVDPFNGTAPGAADYGTGGGAGNTFPGATLPFGMVQLSPDTLPGEDAFGGGYTYGDARIRGFSLRHLSGPGCAAYGDFPITPTTQPLGPTAPVKPTSIDLDDRYVPAFDHAYESAAPGAYDVALDPATPDEIGARLTATTRSGALRLTFPRTEGASVIVNAAGSAMGASEASVAVDPAAREISGSVVSGQFCYQRNRYRLFFAARFDRPFTAHGTWQRALLTPGSDAASDTLGTDPWIYRPIPGGPTGISGGGATAQTGAYATFDTTQDPTVEVRVGISSVSVAAARANLAAEAPPTRSFATLRAAARRTWDAALGRARVSGGTRDLRRRYFTQLYHALLHPSTWSDADGRYRGFDDRIHGAGGRVRYADWSGWDTYRSQMPLLAMLFPGRASDMAQSLVAAADESGALPKWSQGDTHTHVMTGDPADLLLASTWAFGARGFDAGRALAAMVRGATRYGRASTTPDYYERPGLPEYLELGFVPYERNTDNLGQTFQPESVWGTAATTLEYALADFGVAQLAQARCEAGTAAAFGRRAGNWRRVFDPAVRRVQPRTADGSFRAVAADGEDGFVEGSAEQYTLFVPHDPLGLFAALGGRAAALERLDAFFSELNAGPASAHAFLGNEPTLGTPWLYTWAGRPWRAASVVRRAQLRLYADTPQGMPGNDDLGAMSSWWVWTALGLYPAVPGTDVLTVGSPLFPAATLRVGRHTLRITAPGAAPGRPYVLALRLRGRPERRAWLRFDELRGGGTLRFALGATPDRSFGAHAALPAVLSGRSAARAACR